MIYGRASNLFSALDLDRFPPSIANLPAGLTINGQTVYPTLRYKGGDASASSWAPWGYGETLTLQAGTAPTYNNGSPLLGSVDDSVKFNAGGFYQAAASGGAGNIALEDFVLEAIFETPTAPKYILGTFVGSGKGWVLYTGAAGGDIRVYAVGDTQGDAAVTTVVAGTFYHIMAFYDASGSCVIYANGVAGTANSVAARGNLSSANKFNIGGDGARCASRIGQLTIWKGTSWLDTHLQATVAATRFAQLTGVYPQSARGTYLPTAVTRSSAGYLDKVESDGTTKLYYVGSNWPRVCSRPDSSGVTRKGYLSETSAQNICLQSHTLATTWTPIRASVPTTSVLCPDGITRTTCTLHEDATAGNNHYIYQNITTTATLTLSVYAKAANRNWIILSLDSSSRNAWFNLNTGVVGTSNTISAGIESVGNGWYRCWITAAHTSGSVLFWAAEGDNDISFDGLNQDSLYLFGAQIETGNYPSSYIPTTTTAVTRSADLLRYKMDDGNLNTARGSLECNVLCPNIDVATAPTYFMLSDNTDNNRITALAASVGHDYATLAITTATAAQALVAATSDLWNNGWNKLRGIWGPNDARVLVNSVSEGTQDTSVTVPSGLTQLEIGAYRSAGYELNGLISLLKIFSSGEIRQK